MPAERPKVMDQTEPRDSGGEVCSRSLAALRDGTPVCVRAIRPDDKERLKAAFRRLSSRTVYLRFFHPVAALTSADLRNLTEADFRNHVSLVLTVDEESGERLIGLGRFVRVAPAAPRAELGVTVDDEFQGRGAGTLLLEHLVHVARAGGVRELVADMLDDNRGMLDSVRNLKLPLRQTFENGIRRVVIDLRERSESRE